MFKLIYYILKEVFFTIYHVISKKVALLEKQILSIQKKLTTFPEGTLTITKNGKYTKWYFHMNKSRRVISKKDVKFATQLASKHYYTLFLDDLNHEKSLLEEYLKKHRPVGLAQQLLSSSSEFSFLLQNYFSPKSSDLSNWMNSPYNRYQGYPEHLIHETIPNVFVRSKSEAIIFMCLLQHSIPFHYEEVLTLNNSKEYPDFTIRHPKTGKYFYWEHFGKMESKKYQRRTFDKLQFYSSHGIYPSIQLITTYETSDAPLTFDKVERVIEEYFL